MIFLFQIFRMELLQDTDTTKSHVDIREMLELQLSEIEMLQSMFPDRDELKLDDPQVIAEIKSYLDGKTDYKYLQSRIGFSLKLTPGNHKVHCILDSGVTSHYEIDQSIISISDVKKILQGEAKQNPQDSTI
jgi:hypothetical protein